MKKYSVLILMLCLLLVLSACSGERTSEKEPPETSVSASEPQEPSEPEEGASVLEPEEEPPLTTADVDAMPAGTVLTSEQLEEVGADGLFHYEEIPDEVFSRMEGVSFGEGCVINRSDLRYVRVLHTGFDGETHIGELVCYYTLADDMIYVFRELYQNSYPIEKMLLVDNYGGDDELSMEDNNTSCFNFRPVSGTQSLSNHAYGQAIDINPLYNPYITSSGYEPANAGDYVDRSADNPYKIDEDDLCYQLFTERGYTWGGSWNSVKDYQHFEKTE